ncbi:MAG: cation diffusion facilitator family transporter [Acidimicrobiales bacterium]|nr:cation diffusion facilitator family transporter [Acidimicrobiales bacterium]
MTQHHDHHDHHANHDDHASGRAGVLVGVAGANLAFGVVQLVVGLAAGSVAVLADASHQAVDTVGLLLAVGALRLAARPATSVMSYGWTKADALGSYTSCLVLLGSLAWITYESLERLVEPADVTAWPVVLMGVVGLVVNGVSVVLLGHGHDLSVRAARLHLLTDLAGSLLVLVAGASVAAGVPAWIDPAMSLVIVVLVLVTTWRLVRVSAAQLLDRTPVDITTDDLAAVLLSHEAVLDVHHVHVRGLGSRSVSGSAHVVVAGDRTLHDTQVVADELRDRVAVSLGVSHVTLQFECHECDAVEHDREPGRSV